jgi:hypothetical protein
MSKSDQLAVRIEPRTKRAFNKKASKIGPPSEVMRELVVAFVEGRVTVEPPKEPKLEKLYVS